MDKQLNVSVAGSERAKFAAIAPGNERFAFLYVVIAAGALASAMIYSAIAGLTMWQTILAVIGAVVVGWAILFSVLEVRRLARTPAEAAQALEEASNPYTSRTVVVEPPTADPYPHHEDYTQSSGFDQGQLTSRIADTTPFIGRLLGRRRGEMQKVGR
ncbi:MAG TPA: hypothetical protein VLW25_13595 [Bryobacteraceae bacterium]|nr:hypothetical protein [Bryobacteraceae bacterium]